MRTLTGFIFMLFAVAAYSQTDSLPYYEIPAHAEKFTAGTVIARMVDGLGFRYYWATDGLRQEDLRFAPNKEARTSEETIFHIYELSLIIVNATTGTANIAGSVNSNLAFPDVRKATLENFERASDILRGASDEEMEKFMIVFQRGTQANEFPFWNNLNGPIADVLWHIGQVVSFRRSSGNPFSDKVSLFSGTVVK